MNWKHWRASSASWIVCLLLFSAGLAKAQEAKTAQLRLIPESRVERLAGVWVDGQYVGYVDEFKGHTTLELTPGKHSLVIRERGMKDMTRELNLAPGGELDLIVKMQDPEPEPLLTGETGELKILVAPDSAAVFVDGKFEGPVTEFGGIARTLKVAAGKHTVKISEEGYKDYVTTVDVPANQRVTIENRLDTTTGNTSN
ncbi:MAG TPA: PEGA domain-containing protein [Candidatus Acidoferrum sp.]|nr:PEGA domain-containing protein [Candidatus Acidoferrum sp.]